VTAYLLDENVLRELRARGNTNVRKWIAAVDDSDLRLSVATLFEKRRGAQMLKRKDTARAALLLDGIAALEKAYRDRIIPVDAAVVAEWTRLIGNKNKGPLGFVSGGDGDRSRPRSRDPQCEGLRGARRAPAQSIHDPPQRIDP
jgi:predicted nucleic acid-binding protein